jgi:ABC-2 type transport system ATP-binding protein
MVQNMIRPPTRSAAPVIQAGEGHAVPAIEISDLCKVFGSFQVVDHFSLVVEQGEIFALLGPNGSGKTTTINMISGLTSPTTGSISILGYDIRHHVRQIRRHLGVVPQETALYEELTAWDNMDFHADLFGMPRREKKERIIRMLALVQLLERKDTPVKLFSGGMKRRLAIARALLHDPQLIYLDEPTLGVDVQARRAIWNYILALRGHGKTVLITTNYLEEAQALCDRLAILDHGKLLVLDTPAHLKQLYGASVIELELAQPSITVASLQSVEGVTDVVQNHTHLTITTQGSSTLLPQIIALLAKETEITAISVREPHLDEIFLQLTGTGLRD